MICVGPCHLRVMFDTCLLDLALHVLVALLTNYFSRQEEKQLSTIKRTETREAGPRFSLATRTFPECGRRVVFSLASMTRDGSVLS
jgi:hypothetical protein